MARPHAGTALALAMTRMSMSPSWIATAAALACVVASTAAADHAIGTDLASLNLCLYGDCEARGAFAADPYGVYNPAAMTAGAARDLPRGLVTSGSYYHLDVGAVDADIGVGVATLVWEPVAVQVASAYVEAEGAVRPIPGVDMTFRTRAVRLAVALDAERALGVRGLSLGLGGVLPGTTSDLRLTMRGRTFVRSEERRELELIPGLHWHGGERDWFMAGAFLDVLRDYVESIGVDPLTGVPLHRHATANVWFARAGVSILPAVPLGLADGDSPPAAWAGALRIGIDVEYRNLAIPDEAAVDGTTAYMGVDALLVPDAWNPLRGWVRPWVIGGVDTTGGWGAGVGLYGRGPLQFLGCNQAYSSRPLTGFLGDRVEALAVTCSAMVPL